jgi:polyisoprenoid-binding protein YceI
MTRCFALAALAAALVVSGCANPADDKYKVSASAPKPVADSPTATTATPTDPATPAEPSASTPSVPASASASASAADVPATAGGGLLIAPEGSKIEFIGSKVTGSHNGGFKTFSGTAELTPDQSAPSKITVDIDMGSTWADNGKLTEHLKSPDFFDAAKYPKSSFVTTEITPGGEKGATHTITGNLTLHGVTKSISFPAKVTVKDGGMELVSEFALNRKDFQVNYPGKANDLIRDEVVIKIDVKAPKKA